MVGMDVLVQVVELSRCHGGKPSLLNLWLAPVPGEHVWQSIEHVIIIRKPVRQVHNRVANVTTSICFSRILIKVLATNG